MYKRQAYVDAHRSDGLASSENREWDEDALLAFLIDYASDEGIEPVGELTDEERIELADRMTAQVVRNVAGEQAYHAYLAQDDKTVARALFWLDNKADVVVVDGRLTLQQELN